MKGITTLANIVTTSRFLLIIPFLYFLHLGSPNYLGITEFASKSISFSLFILASLTDLLDGYLARVFKEETKIGRFLDPLADKFLIASAFIAFLQLDGGIVPYWMVLIVILREFIITTLRITALSRKEEVETMFIAKAKTTFQLLTIIVILFFIVLKSYYYPAETYPKFIGLDNFLRVYFKDTGTFISQTPFILMFITTLITVGSGIRYVWKNRNLIMGD